MKTLVALALSAFTGLAFVSVASADTVVIHRHGPRFHHPYFHHHHGHRTVIIRR